METLLTGHIDIVSQSFLTHLSMKTDVILSSEKDIPLFSGRNITHYRQSIRDGDFLNIFSSYSFDAVVFFLNRPENSKKDPFEMENLERVLDACAQRPIKQVIVVSSAYVYKGGEDLTEGSVPQPFEGAGIRLFSLEEICRTYRETYHVPVTVLRTSCLFGEEETASYVGESIKETVEKTDILLEGRPDQTLEFLSLTDLGRLIERILLEPQKMIPVMNVPGASQLSLQQFADLLQKKKPAASIRFTGQALSAGPPLQTSLAFQEYHWEPAIKLQEEIDTLIETVEQKYTKKPQTILSRGRTFYQTHSSLLIALELIIGFFLMEYLVNLSDAAVQFRVVDFRLLFVVLFAGAHGPHAGLVAALIASFSTYTSFASMGVDWRIVFYNVENWIPFAVYFITAWILGYIHDRYKRDLSDAKEEVESLSNRYALLNDLYMRSLERKTLYEKQIISYKGSFGKVYQFINQMENAQASSYFYEALDAVEDFLENQTISFYVFKENSQTAHRYVYSAKAKNVSPEWLELNEYPEFKKSLAKDEVWVNKNQLKGYPDYAIPIYNENNVAVLITIHEASFEQMSLYFENLFKITGHLVAATLKHKYETEREALTAPLLEALNEADHSGENGRLNQRKHIHIVAPKNKSGQK